MAKYERVNDIKELIEKATEEQQDCFIRLRGGLRSGKDIRYHPEIERFTVFNNIDETEDDFTLKEFEQSLTGKALTLGALYYY